MLKLALINQALRYYEQELHKVHPLAKGIGQYALGCVGAEAVDAVLLPPELVDRMRFMAEWRASPSELHEPDEAWAEIGGDFEYAASENLDVFLGKLKVKLPREGHLFKRRPRLVVRLCWYVEESTAYVFWMHAGVE